MSGLFDQITNYSPPLLTAGQVNYKGTWDAAANSPALTSPPAATTKGDYYVVSVAGTQFGITFAVGDWIISNGTAWEKVDLTDAVSSVFGRTGAVVGASTDYSSVGLTNTAIGASSPSTGAFTTVTASSTIAATGAVTGSNLSGTNTGDQTTISGNAGSATVLQTARAIYGNNFDGSAALTQAIAGTYGGTGVNNGANTITIAGNVTHAGAFTQTFTATANTSLTLPTTGTLATLAGSEALSNKTITASAFNGTVGATTPSSVVATTVTANTSGLHSLGYTSGTGVAGQALEIYADTNHRAYFTQNSSASNQCAFLSQGARFFKSGGTVTAQKTFAGFNGYAMLLDNENSQGFFFYQKSSGSTVDDGAVSLLGSLTTTGLNSTAIGATTPSTVAATTMTASTSATVRSGLTGLVIRDYTAGSLVSLYSTNVTASNTNYSLSFDGVDTYLNGATSARLVAAGTTVASATSTGLAVTGALSSTGAIYAGTADSDSQGRFGAKFAGSATLNGLSLIETATFSGAGYAVFKKSDGTTIGSISRVTTTDAVVYNTTSDGRLKENLRDFTDSGRLIDSLKPRVFDWKNSDENGKNVVGFIAQEENAADPIFAHIGAVSVGDEDAETITKQWQRSDSALIPILVAELKALRQRVAALEA
jgi:hypothetical protein